MTISGLSLHQYTDVSMNVLNSMLSLLADAMIIVSDEGRILSSNEAAIHDLGGRESLEGASVKSLFANSEQLLSYARSGKTVYNIAATTLGTPPREFSVTVSPLGQMGKASSATVISLKEPEDNGQNASRHPAARREAAMRPFGKMYGENEKFLEAKRLAAAINPDDNVLIVGEPGTGKSTFARAIWAQGGTDKPLIICNCASLNLIDPIVYLCGEMRNGRTSKGLFEMADGGTLLLEGIEDIPLELQELFVRPYDYREVVRDADFKTIPTTFRIIATASPQIRNMVRTGDAPGGFLPSLFFRIAQREIDIPSCKERVDDLQLLIEGIIAEHCLEINRRRPAIDERAMAVMLSYPWPGNIREIQSAVRSACEINRHRRIMPQDLPANILAGSDVRPRGDSAIRATMGSLEKARDLQIEQAMQMTGNNVGEAAKLLGMGRSTLYKYLKKSS